MKKTQLALAAVALVASTAAMAEGVTLYGFLDAGLVKAEHTKGQMSGAGEWDAPRFGLRGSEDLGSGLKGDFNLEAGINTNSGDTANGGPGGQTALFNRAANVGISGDFGTVRLGHQVSPFIVSYVTSLGLAGNNFLVSALINGSVSQDGAGAGADGGGSGAATTGGFFIPNAVSYSTPNIAGFSASILGASSNSNGNTTEGRFRAGNINYAAGDFTVTVGQSVRDEVYKNTIIGGTYTMGDLKLAANYFTSKDESTANTADRKTLVAGASYAIGGGNTVGLNYSKTSQTGADDRTLLNVSATHAFNKTTGLYAFYNTGKKSSVSYQNASTINETRDLSAYGVGIYKNF